VQPGEAPGRPKCPTGERRTTAKAVVTGSGRRTPLHQTNVRNPIITESGRIETRSPELMDKPMRRSIAEGSPTSER